MSQAPYQFSKYVLQECLAYGGMGEIWKSFDTQLQRYVAIKLLRTDKRHDPDFVARFEREARFIASLHHPNIVQIHDFHISQPPESDPAQAYMVMDYVQGQTLADYIRNTSRKGQFPPASDILYLFTAISLAIDYAHQKGMIHQDIKPANILLDQRLPTARPMGEPVLTDFGIAQLQGATRGMALEPLLGTPYYIAPEQALGFYSDNRSDLYSLGIILYEMMTGTTPFRSSTPIAILMQHVQDAPTPPEVLNPSLAPPVSEVILKSIAKQPDERFSTAASMTIALAQALSLPTPQVFIETGYSPPTPIVPILSALPSSLISSAPSAFVSQGLNQPIPLGAAIQPIQGRDPMTPPESILRVATKFPISLQNGAYQVAPLRQSKATPCSPVKPIIDTQRFTIHHKRDIIILVTLLLVVLSSLIFYVSQYLPLLFH